MVVQLVINILSGILGGAVSALTGYFKKTPVPEFDKVKFARTIVVGAIVGAAFQYNPLLTEDAVVNFLQTMGYTIIIDRVLVLVYRKLKGLLER